MSKFDKVIELSMAFAPSLMHSDKMHMSFILHGKRVISFGHNSEKTHPEAYYRGYRYPSLHSELACFINRPRNINMNQCELINVRLSRVSIKQNRPVLRMSKPCIHCDKWVRSMFKSVWYTNDDGFIKLT